MVDEVLSFLFDSNNPLFNEFYALEQRIYAQDKRWTPLNKQDLITLINTRTVPGKITCYLYKVQDMVKSRVMTITDMDSSEMYFAFFETVDRDSGKHIIRYILQEAESQGYSKVIGPRLSNLYLGLLTEGFKLPQTIFTVYNQDWYRDIFDDLDFKLAQKYLTFMFDRSINFDTIFHFLKNRIPTDIRTRNLDMTKLDQELNIFNNMNQVFSDREHYDQRTAGDDQSLAQLLLPIINPSYIVIAESIATGEAVGMVICLPDTYPSKRGEEISGVRFISITVLPAWQNRGVALAMIIRLAKTLLGQDELQYLEASFVMEENSAPISISKKFGAKSGRVFEILEKQL